MRERNPSWLERNAVAASVVSVLVVAAALVQIVNGLPDFFDKSLPWLGERVNLGGIPATVWQLAWVVPLVVALVLLVAILRSVRKERPLRESEPASGFGRGPRLHPGSPDPPSHAWPPSLVNEPAGSRHRQAFCDARRTLLDRLRQMVKDVEDMPVATGHPTLVIMEQGVGRMYQEAKAFHRDWWPRTHYDPRVTKGSQAPPPRERGDFRDRLTAHVRWLEEYGSGCDE